MAQTVILVRHGEVYNPEKVFYGRTLEVPLSHSGRAQLHSVAEQIADLQLKITTIHASPMLRTRQSAEIISQKLNVPVVINHDVIEVDIPSLVGKPNSLRKEIHAQGNDEYTGEWIKKGHEPREKVTERMVRAFRTLAEEHKEGIPVIVSHGDPLLILLYALHNPSQEVPYVGSILGTKYSLNKGHGIILHFDPAGKIKRKVSLTPTTV